MRPLRSMLLLSAMLLVLARVAGAQPIAVIAEVDGSAEIGRAGVWSAATIAAPVEAKDEIRTGSKGRVLLVLGQETVLIVGYDSHVVVENHALDDKKGAFRTLLRLVKGKARAVVSDDYRKTGSVHEIETPTAVTSVRGTEFVILYDPVADVSEVVGVDDKVEVYSVLAWTTGGVTVTTQELTTIERGGYPTAPKKIPDSLFRQYLEGLQFIGKGRPESITIGYPLLTASIVPLRDQPDQFAPPPASERQRFSCLEPMCGRGGKGDVPIPTGPMMRNGGGGFDPSAFPDAPGGVDIEF